MKNSGQELPPELTDDEQVKRENPPPTKIDDKQDEADAKEAAKVLSRLGLT